MNEPKRSSKVNEAQTLHLKNNPACVITGLTGSCQAHHHPPFEYLMAADREDLTYDPRVFRTLAEPESHGSIIPVIHCIVGHAGWMGSYNPFLDDKIPEWKGLTLNEIEARPDYIEIKAHRPPHPNLMDPEQISALQQWLVNKYGPKKE